MIVKAQASILWALLGLICFAADCCKEKMEKYFRGSRDKTPTDFNILSVKLLSVGSPGLALPNSERTKAVLTLMNTLL